MRIRLGYEIEVLCEQPTEFVTLLDAHHDFDPFLIESRGPEVGPGIAPRHYKDMFGNSCMRLTAPPGQTRFYRDAIYEVDGQPDPQLPEGDGDAVGDLPDEAMIYLLASRYCDTDLMMKQAWDLFGSVPRGRAQIRAIFDYVSEHLEFGYKHARPTRTASEAFSEGRGVCRDFAHLAITLCRCMNIPARYANGYLGDIGVPPDPAPMDFNAWCEIWYAGRWWTLDARHNQPRIGRITVARGRDATDIPLLHSFGPHVLKKFRVWTEEVGAEVVTSPQYP